MLYFSWIYFSSIFWNQILHQLNKKNANLNFFLGIRVLPASVLLHHMCTHVVTLMSVVSLGLYNPIPWKSKVCFVLLFFFLLLFNCNPSLTYYLMTVKFVDDSCQLKPYIQVDPTYKIIEHWPELVPILSLSQTSAFGSALGILVLKHHESAGMFQHPLWPLSLELSKSVWFVTRLTQALPHCWTVGRV